MASNYDTWRLSANDTWNPYVVHEMEHARINGGELYLDEFICRDCGEAVGWQTDSPSTVVFQSYWQVDADGEDLLCVECGNAYDEDEDDDDESHYSSDLSDDAWALASAGHGSDEDYGYFGGDDY
jgi:hypothetical protein